MGKNQLKKYRKVYTIVYRNLLKQNMSKPLILAFVGMPGAGKSIAAEYVKQKEYPVVRFGDITDKKLQELALTRTPKNEEKVRESIRAEFGMDAYAVQSASKIKDVLKQHSLVVIDGLYSWEEYLFLKKDFPHLLLVHIFAEPKKRHNRLASRTVRPFTNEEAHI